MKTLYPEDWPQCFTDTIQGWKHLLKDDQYKEAIISSLRFFVIEKKVKLNAFVIMNNHVHFIWRAMPSNNLKDIQAAFTKFTASRFKKLILKEKDYIKYEVNSADRKYNFWKRDSLGIELFTPEVFHQKLACIHYNPVKAGLGEMQEAYKYSSALFYETGADNFEMLEHYLG